jgi:hypothetical protein
MTTPPASTNTSPTANKQTLKERDTMGKMKTKTQTLSATDKKKVEKIMHHIFKRDLPGWISRGEVAPGDWCAIVAVMEPDDTIGAAVTVCKDQEDSRRKRALFESWGSSRSDYIASVNFKVAALTNPPRS